VNQDAFFKEFVPRRRENDHGSGREISCSWRKACEHRGVGSFVFRG
jgi:hypothetical protein